MKSIINYLLAFSVLWLISCGKPDQLAEKRAELKAAKAEAQELKAKITTLEEEIADLDPNYAKIHRDPTLITTIPVAVKDFAHFIEIAGEVDSRQNIVLTAEVPGTVEQINVREGDEVRKGTVLIRLDASSTQRTIDELETALELATTVYERQANLWEQKIGTEIQYLEAKNKKESIERQLETAKVQLGKSVIRAPFSGSVEEIPVKLGETAMAGTELLRLVGTDKMFIEADISEAYIGSFDPNDSVKVHFPATNATYGTIITSVGRVIDKENRTFKIEIKLPSNMSAIVKPNQLAVVKINDFVKEEAVVVPTNLIQRDNAGEYVFIVEKGDSLSIARKVHIESGKSYKNETLVKKGLSGEELLVDQGFREVADGFNVKMAQVSLN